MMWRRIALVALLLSAAGGWWLTKPDTIENLPGAAPDSIAGAQVFWAGGCASCHASPVDGRRARGEDKLLLGGGLELDTPFGTFRVPNISPDPEYGIGDWSELEFVNAMQRGVSPEGRHYYPSFPYTSYAKMAVTDVLDLKAYLDTLPAVAGGPDTHEIAFPWSIRRGIGAWKRLYLSSQPVIPQSDGNALLERGRYLVEAAGHCGECHTPRNPVGGLKTGEWLAGAENPEGEGRVPNITPGDKSFAAWTADDIAYYLESGFTPEFDTAGGSMVAVQENMAELTDGDRRAIAAYLKALPPVDPGKTD